MKIEVAKNAKRNMVMGIINRVVLLVLPFVSRSVINVVLGAEYLGLNSLFSSIVQVLCLTELGFSSALVYNMYKPIAEDDQGKINALLKLYRSAYRIIGIVIITIGISIMPVLPDLISGSYPQDINIYVLFFLYVLNTSISYLLYGYKQSLLVAYQREDVNSFMNLVVQLGVQVSQIVLLLTTKSYYAYIICLPVFTVLNNLWIGYITGKMFPLATPIGKLDKETLKSIKQLVAGTFIQKTCGVMRNSINSICLSAFLGLTMTAIYNNYYVIFTGVTSIMGIASASLSGGIGNHVAIKSVKENFEELKKLDFLYMTISGICTACLICLYQPFMRIWMGEDLLLPISAVALLVLYFYLLKIGDMRFLYSAANGIWWKMKYQYLVEAILSIALNIVLGKLYGVYGIILATIITIISCNFIWGAYILFREYFSIERLKIYYFYHLRYLTVVAVNCYLTYLAVNTIGDVSNVYVDFVLKAVMTVLLSSAIYLIVYIKTDIFKSALRMVRGKGKSA